MFLGILCFLTSFVVFGLILLSIGKTRKNGVSHVKIEVIYDRIKNVYFIYRDGVTIRCTDTIEEAKKYIEDNREALKSGERTVVYKERL